MRQALDLAARALGRTSPNPPVGCVLVREGQVVGAGFHPRAGEPHAEVMALRQAGEQARGATAYVTLEPCAHHGRTPPCAQALIEAGVARVVVAAVDPNPLVGGRGLEQLAQAGVEVVTGVLREEAERQQEVFRHWITRREPFVVFKSALTLDGKTATSTGDARWVSTEAARKQVHVLRDELDAVVVGVGTVLADDPELTCRLPSPAVPSRTPRDPVKVVFDSMARTPPQARLFCKGPRGEAARVLILTTEQADPRRLELLRRAGAEVVVLEAGPKGRVSLASALELLGARGLTGLLLEGGSRLAGSFFDAGRVRKVVAFVAPKLVGGGGPTPVAGTGVARMADAVRLERVRVERFEEDVLIEGYVPWLERGEDDVYGDR
ncbi:bifunctional diaminohydroxyphosphoribosylaminopyrimidine deaminase/5-amino-6-(5-phosphoribosylamino)uracil reductase RibD [Calidithermus roseus]|uniref:Riboflavin biosynthesis protein RibD n=1 Tax=Calidithermus roseus TaxID=1644118 RepID=A0A399ESW7_9DEIN|nr:bifunctional diaminohydroxyphosphoribosylaminopyrimidine deaminase/5-amino-6-(5-phosphoribosylamino)uracil reductase RibD [Calidithermus roseus]RIH86139.1 Riboflavin biosynthesis protein RibD [Calidithermus roseus]